MFTQTCGVEVRDILLRALVVLLFLAALAVGVRDMQAELASLEDRAARELAWMAQCQVVVAVEGLMATAARAVMAWSISG